MPSITAAQAQNIITSARKKADEIGTPMNIAVVDDGGNLVAFERMDGAWLGSISIAIDKAYTARAFDMSTRELKKISQPGEVCYGIHSTNDGRIVIFDGGVLLKDGDVIVGAVGVSGGLADSEDHPVAEAGAAVLDK